MSANIPTGDKPENEIQITPQMIEAGIRALSRHCPIDVAFPIGDVETAVREMIEAVFQERQESGSTHLAD